ncbi:hypothetical protein EVAR_66377_1 [Eumeta japonica]|uniref:Uncharacterized protein n=1 Tax=Eumeta variegata TaxID=151549 RepID=A0A4C1ZJH6_EUMVA|nr:hypothetical protein EVAR_66377_1 [Eumeta japonica]
MRGKLGASPAAGGAAQRRSTPIASSVKGLRPKKPRPQLSKLGLLTDNSRGGLGGGVCARQVNITLQISLNLTEWAVIGYWASKPRRPSERDSGGTRPLLDSQPHALDPE